MSNINRLRRAANVLTQAGQASHIDHPALNQARLDRSESFAALLDIAEAAATIPECFGVDRHMVGTCPSCDVHRALDSLIVQTEEES